MRNDIHAAALRAAAKVAFSVAFVGGCSGSGAPTAEAPANANGAEGELVGAQRDGVDGAVPADASPDGANAYSDASVTDAAAADAGRSCEALLDAAFPVEGEYPGTKQNVSPEVQACCVENVAPDSLGLPNFVYGHRWDCCANLPVDAGVRAGVACTPWGPPVPPAMTKRPKRTAPGPTPDAWRAVA